MVEGKTIRLGAVAKKIGIGIDKIVMYLNDRGFKIENSPNTKLNFEQLAEIAKCFENPDLIALFEDRQIVLRLAEVAKHLNIGVQKIISVLKVKFFDNSRFSDLSVINHEQLEFLASYFKNESLLEIPKKSLNLNTSYYVNTINMSLKHASIILNCSIGEIVDFLKQTKYPLQEILPNTQLSKEQLQLLSEHFNFPILLKYTNTKVLKPRQVLEGLKIVGKINLDLIEKNSHTSINLSNPILKPKYPESLFLLSDKELFETFKKHNSLENNLIKGFYLKKINQNFGFFKNITDLYGNSITYPNSYDKIDSVYTTNTELKNGVCYSFQFSLARINERKKAANPFLIQALIYSVEEVEKLSEIEGEIQFKRKELDKIQEKISNEEEKLKLKISEIENEITTLNEDKEKELLELENKILVKEKKVKLKTQELEVFNKKILASKTEISSMENLINTLKDRVSICRNLQFISEDDENKYLNLLSAKEFKPINHLDFEKDFEKNFSKLSEHIHAYLYHQKNLIYTGYQIKNFLTLIKTHDIVVLSGLSGSGKTQIVKAFAEALGGVAKIIPVKPNWTSSDDLIGYYNPLQMSFLPTPFTEAIVEAINNPNQLYFICLDEMNLARAEYYFADFLSKLEERSKYPEIELYANHEEELFVSEFSTLLNLIESSIKGKKIKSWQEFLDNEEARKKFFEMLGNTDKESMLQLHAKMKRRLIDILKFPSTIKIPANVRFIGAINVDETTHYFSPKILDRIHVVKFDNPLLFEEQVNNWFENTESEKELKPVYVQPNLLSERKEFPKVNNEGLSAITQKLKEINQKFLLPLNIDFGIRSIRQSLNYAELNQSTYNLEYEAEGISLNTVILQKIFPRFIFDGSEMSKNEKNKMEVVKELHSYLSEVFSNFYFGPEADFRELEIGKSCSEYLLDMIKQAERNNSQFNFFA